MDLFRYVTPEHNRILSAMWCNAWARDGCYFSVTEKVESRTEGEPTVRRTALWHLDPTEAVWTK